MWISHENPIMKRSWLGQLWQLMMTFLISRGQLQTFCCNNDDSPDPTWSNWQESWFRRPYAKWYFPACDKFLHKNISFFHFTNWVISLFKAKYKKFWSYIFVLLNVLLFFSAKQIKLVENLKIHHWWLWKVVFMVGQ